MCYYITATMAPGGDESAVRRLAAAFMLKWEPLENPGVLKQLCDGELYFLTTRGMCDCETEFGAGLRAADSLSPLERDLTRDVKKFKKKGWSEAEIDRWIEKTMLEAARKRQKVAAYLRGPHPELDRWIQFVSAVLADALADWVGVLLHWYAGDIRTEAIWAGNRRWVNSSDFTQDYLLTAEEDTLYTVARDQVFSNSSKCVRS